MIDADFDLDAYLRRIDYRGARDATPDALHALCAAHPAAIPFENIDPLLGRPPSLRVADLQAKLVGARRGGYCFEHNALLRQALLAFGFGVTSLAARVVWMAGPDAPQRPRTHMLLLVEVPGSTDDAPRLVDGGFGGQLINVPVRLVPGLEQPSATGRLRITQADALFTLESLLPGGWMPLYRFTRTPLTPIDYEPLNWFTATHPSSLFRHNLLIERLTPAARANLLNDRVTLRDTGAPPHTRRIGDAAEFERVLREVFDLRPPITAAQLFERVPKGLDAPFIPAPPR